MEWNSGGLAGMVPSSGQAVKANMVIALPIHNLQRSNPRYPKEQDHSHLFGSRQTSHRWFRRASYDPRPGIKGIEYIGWSLKV